MGANGGFTRTTFSSKRWKRPSQQPIWWVILFGIYSTHRKTTAWFSARAPSRVKARRARSSASPAALPSFPPSGPLVADVYVLREINACDERRAVGSPTWKLLRLSARELLFKLAISTHLIHTDWRDGLSNGYPTVDVRGARAVKTGHGPGCSRCCCPP